MSPRIEVIDRARQFALRVIRLYTQLAKSPEVQVVGKQLLRSGTSVGAHLREGRRSRSDAEMISKLEVALQELDESMYWMEILRDGHLHEDPSVDGLLKEADEIISMLVAAVKTIKSRRR